VEEGDLTITIIKFIIIVEISFILKKIKIMNRSFLNTYMRKFINNKLNKIIKKKIDILFSFIINEEIILKIIY
jgi:hypothetical protein